MATMTQEEIHFMRTAGYWTLSYEDIMREIQITEMVRRN
jgi:hypothetical protein